MQPRSTRRTRRKLCFVTFVLFVLFVIFVASFSSSLAQEQAVNRREFSILAKDHTFTPDKIEVTQDDLVKITLKSEDRPSSFAIDAYRLIKRASGGLTITFEFRADKPGTFIFYCNLTSDKECKDMKGTLVVKPK
jgi:heme/copper-type cytochrome/quinol oxidase subunit 2